MKYRVTHTTSYHYESAVSVSHNRVTLTPRTSSTLRCLWHRLTVHPAPTWSIKRVDYFGNVVHVFGIEEGHLQLTVTAASQVEISTPGWSSQTSSPPWESLVPFGAGPGAKLTDHPVDKTADDAYPWSDSGGNFLEAHGDPNWPTAQTATAPAATDLEVELYRCRSPRIEPARVYADHARNLFTPERPILNALEDLTHWIHASFTYDKDSTHVHTSVDEVFALKRGVCQDFAHVMVAILRSLGLAARYVSGYLRTLPPQGKPRLVGADQSHAWVSVYAGPNLGWVDVDTTNNGFCSLDHVPIAWGRDYSDVVPFRGVFLGDGRHQLDVSVDVCPMSDQMLAGEG